ncbi:SCP2 sterol-binding domain-containing protein [Litorisediminicola beolgyonensis]|uniref:SCP2 sterol-binding domain-containing protein n=1 Tax=Litorisediminicola beolgyonensis TaxID=1173614 RepID=A0ABW3ZL08_9RHOB
MSEYTQEAIKALNEKLGGEGIEGGTAKFDLEGEGSFILDQNGAREGDGDADVTLSAEPDVFRQMFEGDLNPTSAFMSGKLSIDGDMGLAMKLAALLA